MQKAETAAPQGLMLCKRSSSTKSSGIKHAEFPRRQRLRRTCCAVASAVMLITRSNTKCCATAEHCIRRTSRTITPSRPDKYVEVGHCFEPLRQVTSWSSCVFCTQGHSGGLHLVDLELQTLKFRMQVLLAHSTLTASTLAAIVSTTFYSTHAR